VPEGLDQASSAFQAAINPQAPQPRDTGGRFQPTASRPEPMFEPRPIEGDEKTGDARDAGDDPRLLERERRIADGRADERDERREPGQETPEDKGEGGERSLQRRGKERGDAAADDGHDETDKQKPEGEGEDADEPGPSYEVTVDGATVEVPLDEALKGYIRQETFVKRMNQVEVARQAIEQEASGVGQAREAYGQRLQYLDRLIAEMTPPEPDWDKEFATDPHAAHVKQKTYAEIYQKRHWIDSELQRTAHETQAEYDRRSKDYAVKEFTQFVADAKIPDEKALTEALTLMRSYGRKEGFSERELAETYDRRMLRVLRKAALYDQGQADTPKPVQPGKGRTLIPGVATPASGNGTRRHIDEAQSRLAKSGRLDDAAQVMARLIR
jgi:hypothetical protein